MGEREVLLIECGCSHVKAQHPDGDDGVCTAGADGTILVTSLLNCDTIDTDGDGLFSCGTDATGGGGGDSNGGWEATIWGVDLTPTPTSARIFIAAPSHLAASFRVDVCATTPCHFTV